MTNNGRLPIQLLSLVLLAGCGESSLAKFQPWAPLDWLINDKMERGPAGLDPSKIENIEIGPLTLRLRQKDAVDASFSVSMATLYRHCAVRDGDKFKIEEGNDDCLMVGAENKPLPLKVNLPERGNSKSSVASLPRDRLLNWSDAAVAGVSARLPAAPIVGLAAALVSIDVIAAGFHFDVSALGSRGTPMYLHKAQLDVDIEDVAARADGVDSINCDLELKWTNEPSQRRDVVGLDKDVLADLKLASVRPVAAAAEPDGNSRWLAWPHAPKSAPPPVAMYAWSDRQRTQMWLPHQGKPSETKFSAEGGDCRATDFVRGALCAEKVAIPNLSAIRWPAGAVASFDVTAATLTALASPTKLVGFYLVPAVDDLRAVPAKEARKETLKHWIDARSNPPLDKAAAPYCMVTLRNAKLRIEALRLPGDMPTGAHPTPRAQQ